MSVADSNDSDDDEINPEDEQYDVDLSTIKDLPKIELPLHAQRPASKTQAPEPNPSDGEQLTKSESSTTSSAVALPKSRRVESLSPEPAQGTKPGCPDGPDEDPPPDNPDFPHQPQSLPHEDDLPTPPQLQQQNKKRKRHCTETEPRTKSGCIDDHHDGDGPKSSPEPQPFQGSPSTPPRRAESLTPEPEQRTKSGNILLAPQPESEDDPSTPPRRPESLTPEPGQRSNLDMLLSPQLESEQDLSTPPHRPESLTPGPELGNDPDGDQINIPELLESPSPPNEDDASIPPRPARQEKKRKRSATPKASGSSRMFDLILSPSLANSLQSL